MAITKIPQKLAPYKKVEEFIERDEPKVTQKKEKTKRIPVSHLFLPEILEQINQLAKSQGLLRSNWINLAISEKIKRDKNSE